MTAVAPGLGGCQETVGERKKGIGGHDRSVGQRLRLVRGLGRLRRFPGGDAR